MNDARIARTIWLPLAPQFRKALLDETARIFAGRDTLCTAFGQTVLRDNVLEYIRRAEGPLADTCQKLDQAGRSDVSQLVRTFYPRLMPYYIGCGTKNPVHHTAYVVEFVTTILIGEGKGDGTDLTTGVLAALFHDIAQGLSTRAKITEAHLVDKILQVVSGKATFRQLQEYREDAIAARQEHMQKGAQIAGEMLREYGQHHPRALVEGTVRAIQRLVKCHDNPKIPVAYAVTRRAFADIPECRYWQAELPTLEHKELSNWLHATGEEYLIGVEDWPLQILHEADLLWMVTQDGIDADLARFSPAERKTPREMLENNTRLHRQEIELYRGQASFAAYGFQNGTIYRTHTGYALFEYLTQKLDERFPPQGGAR